MANETLKDKNCMHGYSIMAQKVLSQDSRSNFFRSNLYMPTSLWPVGKIPHGYIKLSLRARALLQQSKIV